MRYAAAALVVLTCGLISFVAFQPGLTPANADLKILFRAVPAAGAPVREKDLTEIVRILNDRLDTAGYKRFAIEPASNGGIMLYMPELTSDQLAAIRSLATRRGTLEFALIANPRDHGALIAAADPLVDPAPDGAAWVPLSTGPAVQTVNLSGNQNSATRTIERDGRAVTEVLVVQNPPGQRVTDEFLVRVETARSPSGATAVEFELSDQGSQLMLQLTGSALPTAGGFKRQLAIILDGEVHSAPSINDVIGGRGMIEGNFTDEEVEQFITALRSGRLPLELEFVEAQEIER